LIDHDWPKIRAADTDINHIADRQTGKPKPFAAMNLVREIAHHAEDRQRIAAANVACELSENASVALSRPGALLEMAAGF